MLTKEEIEKLIKDALTQNKQDTEKLVDELLKPTVDHLIKQVGDYMGESQTTLEKRLEALEKPQSAPKTQDKAESALEARLKTLEAQLKQEQDLRATQEKQASSLRFDSSLSTTLDELQPLHKSVVQELLATRIKQDAVEKDGSWLTKDGKTIKEAITDFFGTDAGKHFLPSSHKDGAGSTESAPDRTQPQISTAEALRQAFLA